MGKDSDDKLKLPPFGLAEDILGDLPADAMPRDHAPQVGKDAASGARTDTAPLGSLQRPENVDGTHDEEGREEVDPEDPDSDPNIQVVTFYLDKEEYALPIRQVQEINRAGDVTRVPNAPPHVLGVMNLRGRIVPVVELKRRLNLGESVRTRNTRIVVVESGPKILGLLVDQVAQVVQIPKSAIEKAPEEVVQGDIDYTMGVGKLENRMIIVLDLKKLVRVHPQ